MKREHLPVTRHSITHKGNIGGTKFYFTIGLFDDGRPGELFVVIGKEGSTTAGVLDSFGIAISMLLQSGWTIDDLARKFVGTTFAPMGPTCNKDIPQASSIVSYIFRWIKLRFGTPIAIDTPANSETLERESYEEKT